MKRLSEAKTPARKNLKYFYRYILIGVINTIVGYSVIFGLMLFGVNPFVSNFIGYFVGINISYFLNKNFNFKSNKPNIKTFPVFLSILALAYVLNVLTLYLCLNFIRLDKYISQVVAGAVYVIVGFLGSRFIAFRDS